jgi:hypothetical protein
MRKDQSDFLLAFYRKQVKEFPSSEHYKRCLQDFEKKLETIDNEKRGNSETSS